MNNEEIEKIIANHEKRISKLENSKKKGAPPITKEESIKISLPEHIMSLRSSGFFSEPKTIEETHQKLQEKYHCELNRVAMSLLRLANKKELRKANRTIKDKKLKTYVW